MILNHLFQAQSKNRDFKLDQKRIEFLSSAKKRIELLYSIKKRERLNSLESRAFKLHKKSGAF